MQNIFISTIRFGAVAVLALSVFIGEAFAAPVLMPANATAVSETSATLVGKVSNPGYKNTTVWFEWGDTPAPTTVVGMRDVYSEGSFQGYLFGLKPGTTYYFRAVAMEGGATVYSSVVTFTTRSGAVGTAVTNSVQGSVVSSGVSTQAVSTTGVVTTPVSQTATVAPSTVQTNTSAVKTTAVQKASNTKTDDPCVGDKESIATKNTAATAAVGNISGVLPGTLIGWVSFLIALLIVFLIFAMIFDSAEERRKAREEARKKKLEREAETE